MNTKIAYWLPRVSAIVISYVAVAFLSLSTVRVSSAAGLMAVIVGLAATAGIWYQWARTDQKYLSFLPGGVLAAYLVVFLMGGFGMGFLQFVFLMALASAPMWMCFYAWQTPKTGGGLYIGLGLFYLLVGFGRVGWVTMILVVFLLAQTGFLFMAGSSKKQL